MASAGQLEELRQRLKETLKSLGVEEKLDHLDPKALSWAIANPEAFLDLSMRGVSKRLSMGGRQQVQGLTVQNQAFRIEVGGYKVSRAEDLKSLGVAIASWNEEFASGFFPVAEAKKEEWIERHRLVVPAFDSTIVNELSRKNYSDSRLLLALLLEQPKGGLGRLVVDEGSVNLFYLSRSGENRTARCISLWWDWIDEGWSIEANYFDSPPEDMPNEVDATYIFW